MDENERRETNLVLVKSLDTLINTVSETNNSVKELSKCVTELVQSEKVRIEKDKYQEKKNAKFEKFIDENTETIHRSARSQEVVSKWGSLLGFMVIVTVLVASGFNFLK